MSQLKAVSKKLYRKRLVPNWGDGFIATGEKATTVYLNIANLRSLYELDLSETPGQERVRDVFIIQCFTGMRVRDTVKFIREPNLYLRNQDAGVMIEIKTQKTGELVWIPVAVSINAMLNKYRESGVRFTYQYYNREIKKILEKSQVERIVNFSRTVGGERKAKVEPVG